MSKTGRPGGRGASSLLIVVKGKHKYFVKYDSSRKSDLFDLLLRYGHDDSYNLTVLDALSLVEKLEGSDAGESLISLGEPGAQNEPDGGAVQPPADEDRSGWSL